MLREQLFGDLQSRQYVYNSTTSSASGNLYPFFVVLSNFAFHSAASSEDPNLVRGIFYQINFLCPLYSYTSFLFSPNLGCPEISFVNHPSLSRLRRISCELWQIHGLFKPVLHFPNSQRPTSGIPWIIPNQPVQLRRPACRPAS